VNWEGVGITEEEGEDNEFVNGCTSARDLGRPFLSEKYSQTSVIIYERILRRRRGFKHFNLVFVIRFE